MRAGAGYAADVGRGAVRCVPPKSDCERASGDVSFRVEQQPRIRAAAKQCGRIFKWPQSEASAPSREYAKGTAALMMGQIDGRGRHGIRTSL